MTKMMPAMSARGPMTAPAIQALLLEPLSLLELAAGLLLSDAPADVCDACVTVVPLDSVAVDSAAESVFLSVT